MSNKNLLLALTLSVAACGAQNKFVASKDRAHDKYLACYALDPAAKKECLQNLQFEAEKLGFKEFINNHRLTYKSIKDSPIFMEDKKAYQVNCKPKGQYLMQFNYETKQWKLIKGEQL